MTCTWFERAPKRRARLAAADDFDAPFETLGGDGAWASVSSAPAVDAASAVEDPFASAFKSPAAAAETAGGPASSPSWADFDAFGGAPAAMPAPTDGEDEWR